MSPDKFMELVLNLAKQLESKRIANSNEADRVLRNIQKDIRAISLANIKDLDTVTLGMSKTLAVTARNGRVAMKAGARAGQRVAAYRRMFMDHKESLRLCDVEPGCFGRFVTRIEKPFLSFLNKTNQTIPDQKERDEARLIWMTDAEASLLALQNITQSQIVRNMRSVYTGRMRPSQAISAARNWTINKGRFRLLLAGTSEGAVRFLVSRDSDPDRKFVVVIGPKQEQDISRGSRAGKIAWRVMTARELDDFFASKSKLEKSTFTNWRGLGLGPNSGEFYVPIPEDVDGVDSLFRQRRSRLFALSN